MKQQITIEQLNELTPEIRVKINKLWRKDGQVVNLLNYEDVNIGTMIEFLYENAKRKRNIPTLQWIDENLCDLLWKEVVEVLEQI